MDRPNPFALTPPPPPEPFQPEKLRAQWATSEGFVPIEEVRNVFVEAIRKLDVEIVPRGTAKRNEMLEFVQAIELELYQRCGRNLADVVKRYGIGESAQRPATPPYPQQPDAGPEPQGEPIDRPEPGPNPYTIETFRERCQLGRRYAMEGSGE